MEKRNSRQSETPKVHQSCDICQTSKIRCGKERPACHRCAKQNLECVYSMSRRNGRPRSRRTGSTPSSAAISRQTSQAPQDSQRQIQPPTPTSPVNNDCGALVPSSELVTPDPSIGVSVQSSNTTTTTDFSNEKHHVKIYPESTNHPDMHTKSLALEPYGGASFDLTNASFPAPSYYDDSTHTLQCDTTAFTFTPMLSPSQTRSDTDTSQIFCFDYFGGGSDSTWTTLTGPTSNRSGDVLGDSATTTVTCFCSTLLIHQLAGSTSPLDNVQGNVRESKTTSYALALQRSTIVLDHCFNVLCCTQCGPKPSSALLLCQAIDGISLLLGMGTVWGETPSEQLLFSTISLAQDEMMMRYGTYTVRKADQRALLQKLMMKRLTEMQRVIYDLDRIVKVEDAAKTLCHEVYAGMVTELKRKVASNVDRLKISMQ